LLQRAKHEGLSVSAAQLLQAAQDCNADPARASTSAFTAKTNMGVISDLLLCAYDRDPARVDCLVSAANAMAYEGKLEDAIELLTTAREHTPFDIDINTYLCIFSVVADFQSDRFDLGRAGTTYLQAVREVSESRAQDLQNIIERVARIVRTPLLSETDLEFEAIVTLGYKLNDDGSMHDILVERLEATLALAKLRSSALIVVTGGLEKAGRTESHAMADWLEQHGVAKERIIQEQHAKNTVENALYTARLLALHRVERVALVSSAGHVRRGQASLEVACAQVCGKRMQVESVCGPLEDIALERREVLNICRDALRAYGMWMFNSPPLLER